MERRRPRFDWNASMNTMLGLSGEPSTGMRTSLVVNYEAAMRLPVSQLDEIQLGRFWSQGPSEAMLDVLIPTTIEHLRHDLFGAWGTPTFVYLVRAEHYATRPDHEPALAALIEAWAARLAPLLRTREDFIDPVQREVATAALETAERYPSALFAFETAYRTLGDRAGTADILARRARRAATTAERIALLVERARLREDDLDLAGAQEVWFEILRLDPVADAPYTELVRLLSLDATPAWFVLVHELRNAARRIGPPHAGELLRRAADLAATKLDEPDTARTILDELREIADGSR